ncbi:MAG TPA: ribbon-helix-helix protein, CopG family [Dongiaceae bacterium]|nr:ribbon-helix-helix protein, CopG family [Dongiaceae bacterium]
MGKYKENPKYNVLSIRITDKEKALFDELKRHTKKNISMLMREAMQHYSPYVEIATSHGQ